MKLWEMSLIVLAVIVAASFVNEPRSTDRECANSVVATFIGGELWMARVVQSPSGGLARLYKYGSGEWALKAQVPADAVLALGAEGKEVAVLLERMAGTQLFVYRDQALVPVTSHISSSDEGELEEWAIERLAP